MSVLRIAKMGNPILLEKAKPVKDPSAPEIKILAQDMQDTLVDIGGSGLAAPQVMHSLRIVVYRMIPQRIPEASDLTPIPWTVMINPEIKPNKGQKIEVWERCLSIPGLHGKVPRWPEITISYQTLSGKQISQVANSSWAALLQHECDHLDGILYPMRMEDLSLLAFNKEPGPLTRESVEEGTGRIDPLFLDLIQSWPAKNKWYPEKTANPQAIRLMHPSGPERWQGQTGTVPHPPRD